MGCWGCLLRVFVGLLGSVGEFGCWGAIGVSLEVLGSVRVLGCQRGLLEGVMVGCCGCCGDAAGAGDAVGSGSARLRRVLAMLRVLGLAPLVRMTDLLPCLQHRRW